MSKKELTLTSKILLTLIAAEDVLSPFLTARSFRNKMLYGTPYDSYRKTLYYLKKKGWLKFVERKDGRFLELTKNRSIGT
jgi:hypothetical protein